MNFLLDLEWLAHRLAHASAFESGFGSVRENRFLLDAIKPTDRVLDVGCGDGAVTADIDARVVGIDHSEAVITSARRAHPNIEFVCADARGYLRTAEPFDVLILSHVLEHLDDPADFLRDISGRFRKIYVEVPDFQADLLNAVRKARGTIAYTDEDHVAEFDRTEIEEMFRECDLHVIDREFMFGFMRYWLAPLSEVARKDGRRQVP